MAHVPAWRRIGLKLDHEADDSRASIPTPPPTTASSTTTSKKRKGLCEVPKDSPQSEAYAESLHTSPSKKRKTDRLSNPPTNGQSVEKQSKKTKSLTGPSKSVTFASDTKVSDSDSDLIQAAQKSSAASVSSTPPSKSKEEKRLKRAQRHSKVPDPNPATTPGTPSGLPPKPYISYLQAHHSDRDRWKFNKGHQNQLLKYIFDLYKTPQSQDEAVRDYILGLQGEGVRQRLRADAEKILVEPLPDEEGPTSISLPPVNEWIPASSESRMESPDDRAASKTAAAAADLAKVKTTIKEGFAYADDAERAHRFPKLLAKRKRAEMILEALRQREMSRPTEFNTRVSFPDQATRPADANRNGGEQQQQERKEEGAAMGPKKRSRGRKRRRVGPGMETGVPDDDVISSSSSSSSSESSDESDDDTASDNNDRRGYSKMDDSSTTSGSSSDDSESASDQDSDSDLNPNPNPNQVSNMQRAVVPPMVNESSDKESAFATASLHDGVR